MYENKYLPNCSAKANQITNSHSDISSLHCNCNGMANVF